MTKQPTLKEQLEEAIRVVEVWQRIASEWRRVAQQRQDELVDIRSRLDTSDD